MLLVFVFTTLEIKRSKTTEFYEAPNMTKYILPLANHRLLMHDIGHKKTLDIFK